MCTVTFLTRNNSVYLTSNRDESPGRRAIGLTSIHHQSQPKVYFPLDETSGGSWISMTDSGRAVCLLNGAYESFIPNPPYRISRGEIVIAAATAAKTADFFTQVDLHKVAPFTLLVYEKNRLDELVWDGENKHTQLLPTDLPQIWSSATLYPADVRAWRKSIFDQWLVENKKIDRESIIAFHQRANKDLKNGFVMNREEIVKTLSVTSIQLKEDSGSILHLELKEESREEILIEYDR
jgi:uncharacterized protein with NRDE domain